MTHNQIQAQANKEIERSNRAKEFETRRSNKVKEAETERSNKASERNTKQGNAFKLIGDFGKSFAKLLNHPVWYKGSETLAKDAATWSFGNPLGTSFKVSNNKDDTLPGFMVLPLRNTIGGETRGAVSSPINTAAKLIYSYVRHANSGSVNYEAPDLMMYIMAVSDVVGQVSELTRLYSLLLTAKGENRYYNRAMIEGLGYNYNDLVQHIPDLRAYINVIVTKLNSLYIPCMMPLFERKSWIYGGIFKDAPVKKSQEYMFKNEGYLKWSAITSENGSSLTFTFWSPQRTFSQIVTGINSQVDALMNDEDIGIMSGDILKAYGSSGIYTLGLIDENYHVESIYDELIAMQIGNAVAAGQAVRATDWNITQTEDGIIQMGDGNGMRVQFMSAVNGNGLIINNDPSVGVDESAVCWNTLLANASKDDVGVDDVLELTRLMCLTSGQVQSDPTNGSEYSNMIITQCGTEILMIPEIYYYFDGTLSTTKFSYSMLYKANDPQELPSSIMSRIGRYCKFDWAPPMQLISYDLNETGGFANIGRIDKMYEVQNYKVVSSDDLAKVNQAAILSLFGTEKLGTAARSKFFR